MFYTLKVRTSPYKDRLHRKKEAIWLPFYYYVTVSPSRSVRCETKKSPAMRVRVEGYTKKLQTRYNKGVQANCKAKGEKYGTKGT